MARRKLKIGTAFIAGVLLFLLYLVQGLLKLDISDLSKDTIILVLFLTIFSFFVVSSILSKVIQIPFSKKKKVTKGEYKVAFIGGIIFYVIVVFVDLLFGGIFLTPEVKLIPFVLYGIGAELLGQLVVNRIR